MEADDFFAGLVLESCNDLSGACFVNYDTADDHDFLPNDDPRGTSAIHAMLHSTSTRTTSTSFHSFQLLPDACALTDIDAMNTKMSDAGAADSRSATPRPTQSDEPHANPPPPPPPEYLPSELPMPMDLDAIVENADLNGLTMSKEGKLRRHAMRHVMYCDQNPFKIGCDAFGNDILNLGSAGKLRNCYKCKKCHSKWSQLHPSLLQDGQNPMIGDTNRRTDSSQAPRSGGYKCGTCKLFKNPEFAQNGTVCKCPKKYPTAAPKITPIPLPDCPSSSTSSISSVATVTATNIVDAPLSIEVERIKNEATRACTEALVRLNTTPAQARPVMAYPVAQVPKQSAPVASSTTSASAPTSTSSREILGLASNDPHLRSLIPFKATPGMPNLGVFPARNVAISAPKASATASVAAGEGFGPLVNVDPDCDKNDNASKKKRGRGNTNRQCKRKNCTPTCISHESKTADTDNIPVCFNCKGMLSDRYNETIRPCVACEDCDEEVAWWCYGCANVTQAIMNDTPEWRCPTHAQRKRAK